VERETDIPELSGSPCPHLVDEPFGRGLTVGETLVMGRDEAVSVTHFTGDAELPDADHPGFFQGVPDHREPASGHELDQVIVFQIDEAVTPSEMDPCYVDPVKQEPGIVSKVAQLLGQMNWFVERIRYVEDDRLAGFLGFGA
jgi:hypothetical protein